MKIVQKLLVLIQSNISWSTIASEFQIFYLFAHDLPISHLHSLACKGSWVYQNWSAFAPISLLPTLVLSNNNGNLLFCIHHLQARVLLTAVSPFLVVSIEQKLELLYSISVNSMNWLETLNATFYLYYLDVGYINWYYFKPNKKWFFLWIWVFLKVPQPQIC
jgi:hypothetical protein